jgi:prepilin-type N-terminal cleavage/methylation domain-containing protein
VNRATIGWHARRQAGFTLVELVVVVLILGVIASASVPKIIARQDKWRVQSAARHLAHDLRQLSKYALAKSQSYTVNFNLALDQYVMPTVIDPAHPGETYQVNLRSLYGVDITSTTIPSMMPQAITWSGHGTPNMPVVILLARNSEQAAVMVAVTGDVGSP